MGEGLEGLAGEFLARVADGKAEEAEDLYSKELYPLVESRFLSHTAKKDYDLLVIPLGSRWSLPALLVKALKPGMTCFICTKERARSTLPEIVKRTGLLPHQYKSIEIEYASMDLASVYDAVKQLIKPYYGKRIAVDLSRGKRVMDAGLAVIGAFYYCDLVYVDEDWNMKAREGVPGTERLVIVQNPYKLMGELEMNYGRELFNRNNYQAASDIYSALLDRVQDPRAAQVYQLISEGYSHWDLFNYSAALHYLKDADAKSRQYFVDAADISTNLPALTELASIQSSPGRLLDALKDANTTRRVFCDVYANALRRAENKRFDEGVARLYRAVEIVSQHRLAARGIDSASPDYASPELVNIAEAFRTAATHAYGSPKEPPHAIALIDGHILLQALGDELWQGKKPEDLRNLVNIVKARDHSMSAHGIRPVTQKDFAALKSIADEFAGKLFADSEKGFARMLAQHLFPKLK